MKKLPKLAIQRLIDGVIEHFNNPINFGHLRDYYHLHFESPPIDQNTLIEKLRLYLNTNSRIPGWLEDNVLFKITYVENYVHPFRGIPEDDLINLNEFYENHLNLKP